MADRLFALLRGWQMVAGKVTEIEWLIGRAQERLLAIDLLGVDDYPEVCVSCAYYAMFYFTWAALSTRGVSVASHEGAIASFGEEFVVDGTFPLSLQKKLTKAYEERVRADYDMLGRLTTDEAQEQLKRTEEFVTEIKAVLQKESQQ